MDAPKPIYLRPRQVKDSYGVSVPTIYRWLSRGYIGGIAKPGMLVEVASLEAYLATWKRRKG